MRAPGMDLKRINEENPGVIENPYPNVQAQPPPSENNLTNTQKP